MFEAAMNSHFAQEDFEKYFCRARERPLRPLILLSLPTLARFAVKIFHLQLYDRACPVPGRKSLFRFLLLSCALLFSSTLHAQADDSTRQLAHDTFKQLIEINTTDSVGNVTTASEAMAQRFRDAGFPDGDIYIGGPNDRKKNLVVRLHGSSRHKPVLLIGHLGVVEARREDWTTDPFQFVEKDGYFYGRGTQDMKDGDAIMVTNFIRLKKQGYVPDRDLILALTADEEGGSANGVDWLLKNHRDWIDAQYAINLDGGEFERDGDKRLLAGLQAAEKVYVDYQFESLNPGGHSSLPSPDNAIYHLAGALSRLQNFSFPVSMSEV